jgi:hypothetical protein
MPDILVILWINLMICYGLFESPEWRLQRSIGYYDEKLALMEVPMELSKAPSHFDVELYSKWFRGIIGGTVVEIGAGDGFSGSFSFFLERFANWTPLHIEGDPSTYERLRMVRPHSLNVIGRVCDVGKTVGWGESHNRRMRGIVEMMPQSMILEHYPLIYKKPALVNELQKLDCNPLSKIFRRLDFHHANLLVMDINGAELSALEGIDFGVAAFHADIFFFVSCTTYRLRSRGPSGRDARKLFIYLEPLGYQCEEKGNHCMCIQNEYLSSWLYGNVTQGKNIYASYLH